MAKKDNQIIKAFACAYFLSTIIIGGILFSVYSFSVTIFIFFALILVFIVAAGLLGTIPVVGKRFRAAAILLPIASILLLSIYVNAPFYQIYKFMFLICFYWALGFFPAVQWTDNSTSMVLTAGLALLIGYLLFNVITAVMVICCGVAMGSFVSAAVAFIAIIFWFVLTGRKRGLITHFLNRNKPQMEDRQLLAVILLALLANALFLNYQYPHWHRESYFEFVKILFYGGVFDIGNLPGNMAANAHMISLFVPPVWATLLGLDIATATYFELLVGHLGLYMAVYIFSMMLFKRHSYALGSLIFIAFLGELHLYAYGFSHLFHNGNLADFFPLNMETWRSFLVFLRSRLMPLFHPWALTAYIDIAKSYAALLLCIYLVCRRNKDWSALIYAGFVMIIIMGCGEEYLLFTFLVFISIYLLAYFRYANNLRITAGLFIGLLIGFPLYFYLSVSKGALNMLNQGSIFIKTFNEAGIYLFEAGKLSFNWPSIRYLLLDFAYPVIFIILFIIQRYMVSKNEIKGENNGRLIFALSMTFILMIFIPLFLGSTGMINWNLNRFMAPLIFWIYILAGASFVYLFSHRLAVKTTVIVLLLLIGIFPTLRLAYSSLVFEPVRIVDGVETVLGLDKHHLSADQLIRIK